MSLPLIPVTLRAWQRRYGLLKPQRTDGGHRLFNDADIDRIREIKRW
ncbi:MerR family transcriptional regulator, partial [Escherichia coli]